MSDEKKTEQELLDELIIRDITERKQAEDRLKRLTDCFLGFGTDPDENINRMTALCGEMLGAVCALYNRLEGGLLCSLGQWNTPPDYVPKDKPQGHICYDVISRGGEDLFIVKDLPNTSYSTTDPNVGRYNLRTYIGKAVIFSNAPIGSLCVVFQKDFEPTESDREVIAIISAAIGVEEKRRHAELALRESEATYRGIIDSLSEAVYILDEQGKFIDVNKGAERMYGYTREELIGMSPADVSAPGKNDLPAVVEKCRLAFSGEPQELEFWGRAKDGHIFPKEVHGYPGQYFGKKVIVAIAHDITERKHAQESLRASEEKYRGVVENIGIGIALISPEMDILSLNRQMQEWFPDISVGKKKYTCFAAFNNPPRDRVCSYCPVVQTLQDGKVHEAVTETPAGEGIINFRIISSPVFDKSGKVITVVEMVENITERVKAEQALRRSEEHYRELFSAITDVVFVHEIGAGGLPGRFLEVNEVACSRLGYTREEFLHMSPLDIDAPESGLDLRIVSERVLAGQVVRFEQIHVAKDGRRIPVEINARLINLGTRQAVLSLVRDITERKMAEAHQRELEEERLKTQKLEAIGTLAGGIAHDFNNLLQGVFGYMSMARLKIDQKDKAVAMLEEAEKALNMSINLTTQLLTFAKGGKPVKKRIEMKPVIENAAKFALSGSRCDCRMAIAEDLWLADADEGQIGQVLQNIVLNACEAMPAGGSIGISAKNIVIPKGEKPLLSEGGRFVCISVKDAGTGIPEKHFPKIFDPYFTTKRKGSGLGLATAYSIIRNHGGVIDVTSGPKGGSTFAIYLPARGLEEERSPISAGSAEGRKGRILVMDDEKMVRSVAMAMIAALGHEVECADEGEDAVERFRLAREAGKPFDVVILDLTVKGGLGGEQTVKRILEIDPDAKVVVSSGYADSPVMSDYGAYGFSAFLNKPYKIDALRDSLSSLLGSS